MPDLDFTKPPPSAGPLDFTKPPPATLTGRDRALTEERAALAKSGAGDLPAWQGVTFGQGIDIDSALQKGSVMAQNLVRRVKGEPIPYTSDEAAAATGQGEREAVAGVRQRHPIASLASELGGGGLSAIATRGVVPEAAAPSFLARALQTGLTGAGFGALTGEGEAGGDIKHRTEGAETGGIVGFGLGAAAPAAEPVLQGIFRGANRLVQGVGARGWQTAAQSAEKRLTDALRQDGVTPEKITAAIKEWKDAGVGTAKLLDVAGENTMGLIRAASSRFGPARNIAARNAMAERANLGPEAAERAGALTPETRTAPEMRQALTEERDKLAEGQYRPAYAKRIAVPPALLTELQDQEGRSAVTAAIKGARANKDYETVNQLQTLQGALDGINKIDPSIAPALRNKMVEQYLAKIHTTGGAVDAIRIAMGNLGNAASKANSRVGAGFFDRAHGISDILDQIPELKAARATYHSMSDKLRGLDLGEAALTKPASQFGQLLKTAGGKGKSPKPMTPEMIEQARTGARQWIQDELGKKSTQARATLEKIATGRDVQKNLEALFGKDEAQRYIHDAQLRIHRLTRAQDVSPRTGSQTQPRGQDIGSLIGGWKGMLSKALDHLTTPGMDEDEATALVRAGLGDPSALIQSFARKPVLRQALSRSAPVLGSQGARTVSQPAE